MRGAGETREKNGRAWRALIHAWRAAGRQAKLSGEPRKFGKSSAASERAAAGMD